MDFSQRNKSLYFTEGEHTTVKITAPNISDLWNTIVKQEKEIVFPYKKALSNNKREKKQEKIIGDIETDKNIEQLPTTLKNLRSKTNISTKEFGVNVCCILFWYA